MIERDLAAQIKRHAQYFPVVAILGPRQSGKTTLSKALFGTYRYISLEEPAARAEAVNDPRTFLRKNVEPDGLIIDEAQRAPELFSYIQTYVDEYKKNGRIIVTGSQNFLLMQAITQTLAGRIALHTLLPLSAAELKRVKLLAVSPEDAIIKGFYPRLFDEQVSPKTWYSDYINTCLERDMRLIQNVTDLSAFQRFTKLCAGRVGQILNITSLANDCGISVNTAKGWLSLLATSYIIFLLHPHYKNFSKRLIKSPKLYFYDTGLVCNLLSIETADQLYNHYLRGGIFECMVIADIFKQQYNVGDRPSCYFWRDQTGHEVDCLIERGQYLFPIEIKAGLTINESFFTGLNYWNKLAEADPANSFIVYAGDQQTTWSNIHLTSWNACDQLVEFTRTHPKT